MAKDELDQQLFILLKSLGKSAAILYRLYAMPINLVALALIAYVAYRMGRATIADPLEGEVTSMRATLRDRAQFTIHLPQRIAKISKIVKIVLVVTLALVFMIAATKYYKSVKPKYKLPRKIFPVLYVLCSAAAIGTLFTWLYQLLLQYQLTQGKTNDMAINTHLFSITKSLGSRAEGLLRIFLCKEKLLGHKAHPAGVCWKKDCQDYRALVKTKSDSVQYLVVAALNFEWCSICKRRVPYDQFLSFTPEIYHPNPESPEQQQVLRKNEYLLHQMQRMCRWLRDISPCNCSKIYWTESTKYIMAFKRREKENDQQLAILQNRIYRK